MQAVAAAFMGTQGTRSTAVQPRIRQAAEEFEAQMMKELIKPMTSDSLFANGTDGDDGPGSAGALNEFAADALGKALSARGGFGIASRIVDTLSRPGTCFETGQKSPQCPQGSKKSHSQ